MAVTYGFYNALNHDRLYDAIQMSSIFDGIIRDGIFSTIGDKMIVTAPEDGLYVNVGSGRAWFNHTWTLNDTDYPIEAEQAEVVLDRIDAVILEVNSLAAVRANSIKFLKGTPSSNPVKPTLIHNAEVNQYALAYVRIRAGQTTILQSDIENAVGTDETPFITGVLQQVSTETLIKQWDAEFDDWFQRMKDQLSQDAAGHLQAQIDDIADEKANNDIISDAWNASTTYAVGKYCIYNNSLWKCLVQHSGQTPTEGTYWTNVNVANEITSVNNSLGGLYDLTDNKVWTPSLSPNVETWLTQFTADKNCIAYFYISIIPFQNGVTCTFNIYKNGTKVNSSVHGNTSYTIIKGAEYNDMFFVNVEEGDIIKFTTASSSSENIQLRIDIKSNIDIR